MNNFQKELTHLALHKENNLNPDKNEIMPDLAQEEGKLKNQLEQLKKENFSLRISIKAWQKTLKEKLEEFKVADLKLNEVYEEIWSERDKFCTKADEFNNKYGVLSQWWKNQMKFVAELENLGEKTAKDDKCKREIEKLEKEIEDLKMQMETTRTQIVVAEIHATEENSRENDEKVGLLEENTQANQITQHENFIQPNKTIKNDLLQNEDSLEVLLQEDELDLFNETKSTNTLLPKEPTKYQSSELQNTQGNSNQEELISNTSNQESESDVSFRQQKTQEYIQDAVLQEDNVKKLSQNENSQDVTHSEIKSTNVSSVRENIPENFEIFQDNKKLRTTEPEETIFAKSDVNADLFSIVNIETVRAANRNRNRRKSLWDKLKNLRV